MDSLDADRIERLIAALEATANSNAQLARVLERKHARKSKARHVLPPEQPITITPLVQAQVRRHLARARK